MEYAQSLLYLRENKTSANILPRKGKLWSRLAETHVRRVVGGRVFKPDTTGKAAPVMLEDIHRI